MKPFAFVTLGVLFSLPLLAEQPVTDPCQLIAKADLAAVLGEIKEGPKPKEGLMKEKQCEWTNTAGSWLSIGLLSADQWGMKKMGANNPSNVKDLGEEAYADKRGTDAELYVRKGNVLLEVRTSAGAAAALKAARLALAKL